MTGPKPLDEQIAEVRDVLLALRHYIIAGHSDKSPIGQLFVALRDTANSCKHCGEPLKKNGDANDYVHAAGDQQGKHRCALEPYGFNAAPMGTPCRADVNPCNCTRGIGSPHTCHQSGLGCWCGRD